MTNGKRAGMQAPSSDDSSLFAGARSPFCFDFAGKSKIKNRPSNGSEKWSGLSAYWSLGQEEPRAAAIVTAPGATSDEGEGSCILPLPAHHASVLGFVLCKMNASKETFYAGPCSITYRMITW